MGILINPKIPSPCLALGSLHFPWMGLNLFFMMTCIMSASCGMLASGRAGDRVMSNL
ncbi:hypothetical protein BDV30DRAFT_213029 [Aspergillus minisclerotigenes]|uniref:Uncharacterized protein n=1 Tax=Aspergillus minisclerotigenes TaxID=656917 RepID=A0A5N6J0V2_9EURO|nr:hypothetical protein BDV30DRAFT_213029 [Aspergillus minisclerotigenes]